MSTIKADNINEKTANAGVSLGGNQVYNHKDKINSVSPVSGELTIDYVLGQMVVADLDANVTSLVMNNFPAGGSLLVYLVQDATGSKTVVFPASFKSDSGAGITISAGADEYDILWVTSKDGVNFDYGLSGKAFS